MDVYYSRLIHLLFQLVALMTLCLATPANAMNKKHQSLHQNTTACMNCHQEVMVVSHPVDFPVKRPLPGMFPLENDSRLTCNTCHNVESSSDKLLRTTQRGDSFCSLCHDESFFTKMKDQGLSLMSAVHFNITSNKSGPAIDQMSIECLGCHDNNNYDNDSSALHGGLMVANHRPGINYSDYIPYGSYKAINLRPAVINLPNGRLSCISCHQGYSKQHGALVISESGAPLCSGCHQL